MSFSEITAAAISLSPDATYYAKIQLTGAESAFGDPSDVAAQFSSLGFTNVTVWTSPPAGFPDQSTYASGSTYWARGTYNSTAKTVGLPPEIKRVWLDVAAQPAAPGGYTPPPDFVGPPEAGWNWPVAPSPSTPSAPSSNLSPPSPLAPSGSPTPNRILQGVAVLLVATVFAVVIYPEFRR